MIRKRESAVMIIECVRLGWGKTHVTSRTVRLVRASSIAEDAFNVHVYSPIVSRVYMHRWLNVDNPNYPVISTQQYPIITTQQYLVMTSKH